MPSRGTMPVARGSQPRPAVPTHRFPGMEAAARHFKIDVAVDRREEQVQVDVAHRAGHPLPGGHPDQRLLLRVALHGDDGKVLAQEERAFGLLLVDGAGQPAPFFRAARVAEDRRLLPGKARRESFSFPRAVAAAARVQVTLHAAATAPELAAVYGPPQTTLVKAQSQTLHRHAAAGSPPEAPRAAPAAAEPVPADKTQAGDDR